LASGDCWGEVESEVEYGLALFGREVGDVEEFGD
jgi:hypothetical protein